MGSVAYALTTTSVHNRASQVRVKLGLGSGLVGGKWGATSSGALSPERVRTDYLQNCQQNLDAAQHQHGPRRSL